VPEPVTEQTTQKTASEEDEVRWPYEHKLTETETMMTPIERLRPLPATNPEPPPVYSIGPDMIPVTPAHLHCAAGGVQALVDGSTRDLNHKASKMCTRPKCPWGMCSEHIFEWEFREVKYKICWACYQDLRMYLQAAKVGHDPWIALIGELYPDLAEQLAQEVQIPA
jgi:hypothetical protein